MGFIMSVSIKSLIQPCRLLPTGEDKTSIVDLSPQIYNIIVTRYFLEFYAPRTGVANVDEWFKNRNLLFEEFTYPSLVNQSNQAVKNLKWFILIEKKYTHLLPNSLKNCSREPFIEILELDSTKINGSTISKIVNEKITATFKEYAFIKSTAVTRIDNDDALAVDYLETLNRAAILWLSSIKSITDKSSIASPVITFPFGVQFATDGRCSAYIFNNNHFLSSFHYPESHHLNSANACTYNHSLIFSQNLPVLVFNTDKPMWMEVIHGQNICNWFRDDSLIIVTDTFRKRFQFTRLSTITYS